MDIKQRNEPIPIKVKDKFIGLQIKPVSGVSHIPEIYKERNNQLTTHKKFTDEFGGKVFYIYSFKDGEKKKIQNQEVIQEIQDEIISLSK